MEFTAFMPRQTLPESKKDEKWYQECVNSCMSLVYSYDTTRRSGRYDKKINYDLYSNIFHKEDLRYVFNPLGLKDESLLPAELWHYDIVTPIFNLLIGEESQRLFNWTVRVVDEASVSGKLDDIQKMFTDLVMQRIMNGAEIDPNTGKPIPNEKAIEKLQKYVRYNYKDMKETTATKILNYLIRRELVDRKLLKGFEDVLIAGEEIYRIDILNDEPTVERRNPLEVFYLLPHNSDYLDDSDIIVEQTWMSAGQIVDNWHNELTTEDINYLEHGISSLYGGSADGLNYEIPRTLFTADIPETDSVYDIATGYNYYANNRGNIRVVRSTWKSKRKIGILMYPDPMTGEEVEMVVDETFKPEPGMKVEWEWINEYREGTKIGNNIYVGMRPCRVQRRSMTNLSECKSPYVGTVYNATNAKSVSLMDRLKTYQYLYNIIMFRTQLALAKSIGKVAMFDLASIPRQYGFDVEKWIYYIQSMNIGFFNSFEESSKGERVGALGSTNMTKEIDLEQGKYIDMHIKLLDYIENRVEELSGVTRQRKGQMQSSELVGNVQRSVVQSSLITEKWFDIHNDTKRRVLEALLDVAREAYKGEKVKNIQFILDDMATEFLRFDGAEFNSAEYGVFVSNSSRDNEALNQLKQLTQVGLNSDKLNFTQVIDVLMSDSISDTRRKIETYEEERQQMEQQNAQMQQEQFKQQIEEQKAIKQAEMDLRKYEIDSTNETKIQVAEIVAFSRQQDLDINANGIPDPVEIAKQSLEERKLDSDMFDKEHGHSIEREKISAQRESEDKKAIIEKKKLELEDKKIASKEKIEKMKADVALRVAKENKGKYDKPKPKK